MRQRAAFAGTGLSQLTRYDDIPLGRLAVEACTAAIADAGLKPTQIDGLFCVPDQPFAMDHAARDGIEFVSGDFMASALGLDLRWADQADSMLGRSLVQAVQAVESGVCRYALVFRALHSPRGSYGHTREVTAAGPEQFSSPYGVYYAAMFGHVWHQYQDRYGSGSREQMAALVTHARRQGLLCEYGFWARYRPAELTAEDYLGARMVSTPLSIYDCDLPVQACGAFVLTTAERAASLRHPPAHVLGLGISNALRRPAVQAVTLDSLHDSGTRIAADLWRDSGLTAADVDVADLYDGFSIITISWLEALGLCARGEAFEFVQGARIAPGGALPINPSGGSLGAGRLHGLNHLVDAIEQVTGRAGARQVPGAGIALAVLGPAGRTAAAFLLGGQPL